MSALGCHGEGHATSGALLASELPSSDSECELGGCCTFSSLTNLPSLCGCLRHAGSSADDDGPCSWNVGAYKRLVCRTTAQGPPL